MTLLVNQPSLELKSALFSSPVAVAGRSVSVVVSTRRCTLPSEMQRTISMCTKSTRWVVKKENDAIFLTRGTKYDGGSWTCHISGKSLGDYSAKQVFQNVCSLICLVQRLDLSCSAQVIRISVPECSFQYFIVINQAARFKYIDK